MNWPWKRHSTPDPQLERARVAFEQNRVAARRATSRLIAATAAEQDQIRRNHLGEMLHAALMSPGGHDR